MRKFFTIFEMALRNPNEVHPPRGPAEFSFGWTRSLPPHSSRQTPVAHPNKSPPPPPPQSAGGTEAQTLTPTPPP